MPEPTNPSSDTLSDPYLDQFAQLASSVPDLASTLTTQVEQDAEEDNVSFLRSGLLDEDDIPNYDEANEHHRRMRRAVDSMIGSRIYTPAQLQELGELQEASDAGRLVRSEYDGWAPGTSDDEEEGRSEQNGQQERPQSSTTLLDEQVMARDDHLRDRMRLRRLMETSQVDWRDRFSADSSVHSSSSSTHQPSSLHRQNGDVLPAESSLRTTALLQAVRRNPQFSLRSRNELQRYILDRERGDEQDGHNLTFNANREGYQNSSSQRRQIQREATVRQELQQHRDLLVEHQQHRNYLEEQIRRQRNELVPPSENRRRRYWQTPSPCVEKRRLDDAIKYLGQLRLCESDQEGQKAAEDRGFDPEQHAPNHPNDFLLNTHYVPPPPQSSWLKVGGVLSGTQHGTSPSSLPSYTPLMPPSMYRSRTRNPHFGSSPPETTSPTQQQQPPETLNTEPSPAIEEERWPVKVTIHSVDHNEMTLTGTMEAFNVPDKSSPTKVSSITTYLEGEIIDFNTFSLETKSFKADTRVDGMYWRKLPPFKDLADDEAMVRRLLSTGWLREELMQKWILMRWKEKCFVTPSDAQTALTISGFYYVSLRREDGHVEGLYYDPHSNPYQHLSLMPEEKRTFPAYRFM